MWDVAPGYLSRESLLGEHRGCLSGPAMRHAQVVAEMRLRGYRDLTPLAVDAGASWPPDFVTPVADQFTLLKAKYAGKARGRIPLPINAQDLWAHHKYSMLARDPAEYRRIGRRVAAVTRRDGLPALAEQLAIALREPPSPARLANALQHMWGHVSDVATADEQAASRGSAAGMLAAIQSAAVRVAEPYLMSSTALSELAVFVSDHQITKSPDHLT